MAKKKLTPDQKAIERFIANLKTGDPNNKTQVVSLGWASTKQSQQTAEWLAAQPDAKKAMDNMSQNLEKAWQNYKQGIYEIFEKIIDSPANSIRPEDKKLFAELGFRNVEKEFKDRAKMRIRKKINESFNKGRQLEFKVFLLSGNIEGFDPTDNVAGYVFGDIDILLPPELRSSKNDKIISSGQIKGPSGSFTIARETGVDKARQDFDRILNSFAGKMGSELINKTRLRQNLENRISQLSESLTFEKDLVGEKDPYARAVYFFQKYLSLSASHYYLMGAIADRDLFISVPHEKFLDFVKTYPSYFRYERRSSTNRISYRWTGGSKSTNVIFQKMLLGKGPQFHLHLMRGLVPFINMRRDAFGYDRGSSELAQSNSYKANVQTHRDFLSAEWQHFIIPHTGFLGGEYYNKPNY